MLLGLLGHGQDWRQVCARLDTAGDGTVEVAVLEGAIAREGGAGHFLQGLAYDVVRIREVFEACGEKGERGGGGVGEEGVSVKAAHVPALFRTLGVDLGPDAAAQVVASVCGPEGAAARWADLLSAIAAGHLDKLENGAVGRALAGTGAGGHEAARKARRDIAALKKSISRSRAECAKVNSAYAETVEKLTRADTEKALGQSLEELIHWANDEAAAVLEREQQQRVAQLGRDYATAALQRAMLRQAAGDDPSAIVGWRVSVPLGRAAQAVKGIVRAVDRGAAGRPTVHTVEFDEQIAIEDMPEGFPGDSPSRVVRLVLDIRQPESGRRVVKQENAGGWTVLKYPFTLHGAAPVCRYELTDDEDGAATNKAKKRGTNNRRARK
eukprot:g5407.t1